MILQKVVPRRSTRRPIIILCAVVCIVLLGAPFTNDSDTKPTKTRQGAKDYRTAPRIHPRPKAFEAAKANVQNLLVPKIREWQNVMAFSNAGEATEEHDYKENGLVEVNPAGQHPIYDLVNQAQNRWSRKLNEASKTLQEAVDEYMRRYKRLPPKGFDDWWAYVQEKNVQLPDEYDQIYRDLEPFWGMDPHDLQTIQRGWEAHDDSFTIGKDSYDDILSIKNNSIANGDISRDGLAKGAYEMIELLEDVSDKLPPFRAVFSPHDNPNLPTDYELKEQALEAARLGKVIDINNPPRVKLDGWVSGCPPDSVARGEDINWEGAPANFQSKPKKSFIHDHRASMDPCRHPSHLLLHGQFISHRNGPVPHRFMVPQFSYGPTMLHHDITPAMPINWVEDIYPRSDDPPWEERWDARLQWRGSNTGIWHAENKRWDLAHRARLVNWGADGMQGVQREFPVLMPTHESRKVGRPVMVRQAQWAPAMVDVAFAGAPLNCPPPMCEKLEEVFEFRKRHDAATAGRYKYYIDVDGNGWSSRFKRLITSNALVFKSTVYPEWFTDRVQPWVHYVPIQVDFSDLWDALVFFRGGPSEKGAHDEMAKRIAQDGREWSKRFWRKEDMVAYNFRLFLEYSRVMSPERESLSFYPSEQSRRGQDTKKMKKNRDQEH